jgi:hypothetical protein
MKRSLVALGIAVTFGAAASAQQQTQPAQPQSQSQQQQQQQQKSMQGQSVTLTGCVYQPTDQPTNFALQRTDGMSGSSAASGGTNQTSNTGSSAASSGATSGTSGAAGTSGTSASGGAGREQGAWYRLSASATQDLKEYVGKAVRISGTVIPGKDEKGADVIVHHIEPGKVTVTALDLKPAPQLQIQSITSAQGQCSQGSNK